ncbi:hypothetical protein AYO38_08905 [bacterium SCGC AG-212-C10]|nr:hypothetical protein AYO38_08905 [bacterium SCGC AG-212-C10]
MFHSLRVRLLITMIAIPLVALASVAAATTYTNRTEFADRVQFRIIPVPRPGVGVRSNSPDDFERDLIVNTTPVAVGPGSQPFVFEPLPGETYLIQADPGFVDAFQQDQDRALAEVNRNLAIAVIAVFVLAALAAYAFSRRLLGPVGSLTTAARRLEAGDLKQRVEIERNDEVGELARAFNAMAASLDQTETLRKQMVSDIAHELRTPLNNVSGYLDAIEDGVIEPDRRTVTTLQDEAQLLVRLVNDLEQLSLADAGRQHLLLELVDLGPLVRQGTVSVAARAESKEVRVSVDAPDELFVNGDSARLAQVLRNLLDNAIRHTPCGGEVRVSVSRVGADAVIDVIDSGAGIPEEHLPYIFERFYRADASRTRATGGAGLGLAIVRQIVEGHGGSVTATNAPGSGARFHVTLPAVSP